MPTPPLFFNLRTGTPQTTHVPVARLKSGVGNSILDLPTGVYPSGHDGRFAVEYAGAAGLAAADTAQATAGATGTANFSLTGSTDSRSLTIAIKPSPLPTHNLTITVDGPGTVSGNGAYTHGVSADTSTVTPGDHATFTSWTGVDGAECATGSVSVVANKECTAIFLLGAVLPPANKIPSAFIASPAFYTTFPSTDLITFRGLGFDAEDGNRIDDSLVWMSSIDGFIGIGEICTVLLNPGTHAITLTITDSADDTSDAIVMITVTGPVIGISTPEPTPPPTPNATSVPKPTATSEPEPTVTPVADPTPA